MEIEKRLLGVSDVIARYGIGRTTLYNWLASGKFPSSVQAANSRLKFWLVNDLEDWEMSLKRRR